MANDASVEMEYASYGKARGPLRVMLADSIERQRRDLAAMDTEIRSLTGDKRAALSVKRQRSAAALQQTLECQKDEQRRAALRSDSRN